MPQRNVPGVVTLPTPGIQGADSWIQVQRRSSTSAERTELRADMEARGVRFDIQGTAHGGEFTADELSRLGMLRLAESLVDWNWVDGEGLPLPKPDPGDIEGTMMMLREQLLDGELQLLSEIVGDFLTRPGNSKRSKRS